MSDNANRPTRSIPERDADPARGLEPPTARTPETAEMKELTASRRSGKSVWTWPLVRAAILNAVPKLDPRKMARNPVMFIVEIGTLLSTFWFLRDAFQGDNIQFSVQITAWLWFTLLFANFAEAIAEARGKAQADTLRATKKDTPATRLRNDVEETVSSNALRKGDIVIIREGEIVPGDGDVVEGVAYVNEAAITGESAPVLKEPGTDIRSGVTGGTQVVSDWLKVRITADPGETFLDRMIALVEGASRQKTPNEIALTILLAGLSIIFLMVVVTLQPFAVYAGDPLQTIVLVAAGLPAPDNDRRPALGDRHRRHGPGYPLQRAGHVGPRR